MRTPPAEPPEAPTPSKEEHPRGARSAHAVLTMVLGVGFVLSFLAFCTLDRRAAFARKNSQLADRQMEQLYELATQSRASDVLSAGLYSSYTAASFHEEFIKANKNDPESAPELARAHHRLGSIYLQFAEYGQAERAYRSALELLPEVGSDASSSPDDVYLVVDTWSELARTLVYLKRIDEAEPLASRAYQLIKATQENVGRVSQLGSTLANCCQCLVAIASRKHQNGDAVEWARLALDQLKTLHGNRTGHPDQTKQVMDGYHILVQLLREQHQIEEADAKCVDAIEFARWLLSKDPLNGTFRLYVASAEVTLADIRGDGDVSEIVVHPFSVAVSDKSGVHLQMSRRVTSPFVSPGELENPVTRRSVLDLPAGECILLHKSPRREFCPPSFMAYWMDWMQGDPATDQDDVRFYREPSDPLCTSELFDYYQSGTFNCHTFAFRPFLGLNRLDWLTGMIEDSTNGVNPVKVVLDSYFRPVKVVRIGAFGASEDTLNEFDRDSDFQEDDIICFTRSSDPDCFYHTGRVRKVNDRNWVLSKIGMSPTVVTTLSQLATYYIGKFDQVEIYRLRPALEASLAQ